MDLYFGFRYKSLSLLDPATHTQFWHKNLKFVCLSFFVNLGEIFSNLPEILRCCCTFPVLLKQFWVDWLIECPRGSWRRAQDINFLPRTEKMSQGGKIHENTVNRWNYKVCGIFFSVGRKFVGSYVVKCDLHSYFSDHYFAFFQSILLIISQFSIVCLASSLQPLLEIGMYQTLEGSGPPKSPYSSWKALLTGDC